MAKTKLATATVMALATLTCLGCGPGGDMGYVTGTVTLDGEPLPDALVTFTPEEGGRPSFGRTDEQGRYELTYTRDQKGAVIGKHRVSISTFVEGDPGYPGAEGGGEGYPGAQGSPEKVPAKYNVNSELTEEVQSGSNEINFELDSEGEIIEQTEDVG